MWVADLLEVVAEHGPPRSVAIDLELAFDSSRRS